MRPVPIQPSRMPLSLLIWLPGLQTFAGRYPGSFGASSAGRVGGGSRAWLARVAWCPRTRAGAPRHAPRADSSARAGGTGGRSARSADGAMREVRRQAGTYPHSRRETCGSAGAATSVTLAWDRPLTRGPGVRRVDVDYRRQLVEPPPASTHRLPGRSRDPPRRAAVREREPRHPARTERHARIAANDCTDDAGREDRGHGDSHLRRDGRRLGGARPLRPPARGAPRAHQGAARRPPSSARCCAST